MLLYLRSCPDAEAPYVDRLRRHYTGTALADFDQAMLDAGAAECLPGAAPATINRNWLAPAAAILHCAARAKLMPWLRVEKRREPRGRNRWITPARFLALVDALEPAPEGRHPAALAVCMATTRARIGEAIRLDWAEHVDLAGRTVTLTDTKNGNTYVRPIGAALLAQLANLPHRRGRVFGYTSRWQVYADWRRGCVAVGLADFHPHDLGHCFATWARQGGMDLRGVMDMGGWEDIKSVARYAHVATPEARAAVDRLLPAPAPTPGRAKRKRSA